MAESPNFLGQPHDPEDPSPWLALYLDQSIPMADAAKVAWLADLSSRNRQFVLPFTRPFARLAIVLFQLFKALFPHTASSSLLHRILAWSMKTWLSPNANFLIMRHFHLGSQILRFIADNTAHVHVETTPLEPRSLDTIKNHLFVKHDINLYNFVIHLNWQLKQQGVPFTPREPLDFSAIRSELPPFEPFPQRWTNFIDLESAIELYTPLYQLLLTDRDFWRATNSLQLDETIALYVARIIGSSAHVALANNRHPLVPLTTLRAGYRLVLHGLSTELLHALLVGEKERAEGRTNAAPALPRASEVATRE
jgi:hypothetical protein